METPRGSMDSDRRSHLKGRESALRDQLLFNGNLLRAPSLTKGAAQGMFERKIYFDFSLFDDPETVDGVPRIDSLPQFSYGDSLGRGHGTGRKRGKTTGRIAHFRN